MDVSFTEFISKLPSDKDNDIRPTIGEITLLYLSGLPGASDGETRARILFEDVWNKKIVPKKPPANRPTSDGRHRDGGASDFYTNIIYDWGKTDRSKRRDKKLAWAVFYYLFRHVQDASYFVEIAKRTWPETSLTFQRFVYAKSGGSEADSFQRISERFHASADEVRREIGRYWNIRKPHPGLQAPHYLSKNAVAELLAKNPFDSVWLSPHNHHSIPLIGRDEELRRLDAFVASDKPFLVCPVIAPSGAGKTRLISEWMKSFVAGGRANEWDAGFVISRDPTVWSDERWTIERNTLIVIDYTFAYDDVVEQIARRALNQLGSKGAFKIRLLVIDHVLPKKLFGDLFWSKMFGRKDEQDFARAELITEPIELAAQEAGSTILAQVIATSASLGDTIYAPHQPIIVAATEHLVRMGEEKRGGNETVRHPLFAALMGQAIREATGGNLEFGTWTRRDLIDRYFTGPLRFPWSVWSVEERGHQGLSVGALVSAATLRRGMPERRVQALLGPQPQAVAQFAKRILSSDDDDVIKPFEPDILGEAFFLKFLKALRAEPGAYTNFAAMLDIIRDDSEASEVAANIQETIARLTRNLANDDQRLDAVRDGWADICDFLRPERFASNSRIRVAISYAIAEVAAQLGRLVARVTKGETEDARRIVDHLNDVRTDLERQLSREDIEKATKSNLEIIDSTYNFLKFFEGSLSRRTNEDRRILVDLVRQLAAVPGKKRTGAMLMAEIGTIQALNAVLQMIDEDLAATDENGWTALMQACQYGYAASATLLMGYGANPNQATVENGTTALMIAAANGYPVTSTALLDGGAEINQTDTKLGFTALMFACLHGHTATAALLLDRGASIDAGTSDVGTTALMMASANGHIETVRLLLDRGAQIDCRTNDKDLSALLLAYANRRADVLALLIERGADANSILLGSCELGDFEMVALLLTCGMSVNVDTSGHGWTPLIEASIRGQPEIVSLLLDRGADINRGTDGGWTPLLAAAFSQNPGSVAILLDRGADIEQTTDEGFTALMASCDTGRFENVALLVSRGASINRRYPASGWTALDYAKARGFNEICQILRDAGGRTGDELEEQIEN